MSTSATSIFTSALLSEAAYVSFVNDDGSLITVNSEISQRLVASGFSEQQANDFVATWEIVHQQPNTATGFSATLFRIGAAVYRHASNSLAGGVPCLR